MGERHGEREVTAMPLSGNWKELFDAITPAAILAFFGGLARYSHDGVISFKKFLSNTAVSAFSGVVTHLLIQDIELAASFKAAMVAVSGYSGPIIIDAIQARMVRVVKTFPGPGAETNNNNNDKGE